MPVETRSSGRRARRAAMAPDTADALPGLTAQARMFLLDEGLYAVNLGPETASDATGGVALPAFLVSTPPSDEYDLVEIVASSGDVAGWFGAQGGTVVLKAPPGGGIVLLTSYGASEGAAEVPVDVRRLDRPRETPAAAATRPLSGPAPSTPASEFPAAGLMPAAAHAADWGSASSAARSSCISSARATAASRRPAGSAIAAGGCASKHSAYARSKGFRRATSNTRPTGPTAARPRG